MPRKIKAIQTVYKGYKFRSRLEARWAVFFDELNIEWMYEPEGYELNDGFWYLPDFFLPYFHGGLYCEVKFDGGDFSKARLFNESTRLNILECEGTPEDCAYIYNWHTHCWLLTFHQVSGFLNFKEEIGSLYLGSVKDIGDFSGGSKVWLNKEYCSEPCSKVSAAIIKAKQARFGKKGLMI